jgi:Insertion element 4 transposase N-terminal/Transposase DDE domain
MAEDLSRSVPVTRLTDHIGIGVLTRLIPRDVVDEVLAETDRLEQRRRLLPARVVVYYVLALCLFFSDAYEEVMRKLVGGLQFMRSWDTQWVIPSASALCQARKRLGEEPLRALFDRVAVPMMSPGAGRGWFHGWRVMALDGVMLDVPDTPANVEAFGRSGNAIGDGPFPQARIIALSECGSRAVVGAEIGECHAGERELARGLLDLVTPDMLVLADRGFYSYEFWQQVRARDAQLLWRIKTHINLPVYEMLPDGSYLSALAPKSMRSDIARGKSRRIDRYEIPVRVVDYTITNRGPGATGQSSESGESKSEPQTIRLVTSIIDPDLAPAAELAALYHQRWEIELAFDEIQTHQMGRPRVLRSRLPEMARQEIWALLLTHYAIRHLMHEAAADDPDVEADLDRLSFMRSLRVIRRQVTDQAAFSPHRTDQGHQRSQD